MIRALVFAALVGGATWASHVYDRWINREDKR